MLRYPTEDDDVMRGRIKPGAIVGQDFGFGTWPAQRSGEPIDPDMVFDIERINETRYKCIADGYGYGVNGTPDGEYGNGAIYASGENCITFIDA